jgi:hypothetical protein
MHKKYTGNIIQTLKAFLIHAFDALITKYYVAFLTYNGILKEKCDGSLKIFLSFGFLEHMA